MKRRLPCTLRSPARLAACNSARDPCEDTPAELAFAFSRRSSIRARFAGHHRAADFFLAPDGRRRLARTSQQPSAHAQSRHGMGGPNFANAAVTVDSPIVDSCLPGATTASTRPFENNSRSRQRHPSPQPIVTIGARPEGFRGRCSRGRTAIITGLERRESKRNLDRNPILQLANRPWKFDQLFSSAGQRAIPGENPRTVFLTSHARCPRGQHVTAAEATVPPRLSTVGKISPERFEIRWNHSAASSSRDVKPLPFDATKWDKTPRRFNRTRSIPTNARSPRRANRCNSLNPWKPQNYRFHLRKLPRPPGRRPAKMFASRGCCSYRPRPGLRHDVDRGSVSHRSWRSFQSRLLQATGLPRTTYVPRQRCLEGMNVFISARMGTPRGGCRSPQAASPIECRRHGSTAHAHVQIRDCGVRHLGRYGVWFPQRLQLHSSIEKCQSSLTCVRRACGCGSTRFPQSTRTLHTPLQNINRVSNTQSSRHGRSESCPLSSVFGIGQSRQRTTSTHNEIADLF